MRSDDLKAAPHARIQDRHRDMRRVRWRSESGCQKISMNVSAIDKRLHQISNRVSIGLETGIRWGKGNRGGGLQANVAAAGKLSGGSSRKVVRVIAR
jgi:hypothetical protein